MTINSEINSFLSNYSAFEYETPSTGTYEITQCWTNGTVTFQCGAIKIRYNIHHIKPHTYDTEL